MTITKPWPLPCQTPEQLATSNTWRGYVGADNIEAITERVKQIVVPGRTFILTHQDSDGPARVEQGCTLYINPKAFRKPIEWRAGEHGGGMSVNMSPGFRGFGVGYGWAWNEKEDGERIPSGTHPITSREIRAIVDDESSRRRFAWSWMEIAGGLEGVRPGLDLITIRKCNETGYRENVQVIPCDIPWQIRHERDAITLDQAAKALRETDVDEFHPADGLDAGDAKRAAEVLAHMAANLRRWREPLTTHEQFPAFEEMR